MADDQTIKLCECGCGQPTKPARQSNTKIGNIKGQPQRFVKNHHNGRPPRTDVWERIKRSSVWDGECLVWQRNTVLGGYGRIVIDRRKVLVHRAVYEYFNGPIPEGLTIDHVRARGCHSRACCNPSHLEVVTFRDNVLRGSSFAAKNARATHCPSGHPYDEANTRWYEGRRYCRQCHTINGRKRRREQRERRAKA